MLGHIDQFVNTIFDDIKMFAQSLMLPSDDMHRMLKYLLLINICFTHNCDQLQCLGLQLKGCVTPRKNQRKSAVSKLPCIYSSILFCQLICMYAITNYQHTHHPRVPFSRCTLQSTCIHLYLHAVMYHVRFRPVVGWTFGIFSLF